MCIRDSEHGGAGRRLVEMHRLRIELRGESDDLLARDQPRAVNGDRARLEVFPMQLRHFRFLRHSGTRAKLADPESILRSAGVMDSGLAAFGRAPESVSYTHLRAHET